MQYSRWRRLLESDAAYLDNHVLRFLYGIPIMMDCHDHVDFKANPQLNRWEENLLRLGLIRKFIQNMSEKHPETEVGVTSRTLFFHS